MNVTAKKKKPQIDYAQLEQTCENALRQGKSDEVSKSLNSLNLSQIPRRWSVTIAKLNRRVGLIGNSLRLLTPIVRDESGRKAGESASPQERAEYAAALQRQGAIQEALDLLERTDGKEVADVFLFRAFCYFNLWEYESALPELKSYIELAPNDYMALVGKVNLAAALSAVEDFTAATALLEENIHYARTHSHHLLYANCLEIMAQIHVYKENLTDAKTCLELAADLLGTASISDQLFVKKWQAIIIAFQEKSVEPLIGFRREAILRGESEAVRDTDFYMLKIFFIENDFMHLFCGTPYRVFRSRLMKTFKSAPGSGNIILGTPNSPCLDLMTGEVDGKQILDHGEKSHLLLELLLRDFYKHVSTGEMHACLFPGEFFNIFSSPQRIRQIVHRMRKTYEQNKIPIAIQSQNGTYSLSIQGDFSIKIPMHRKSLDVNDRHLMALKKAFANSANGFTAAEASQLLNITRADFMRFIADERNCAQIRRIGVGPATSYIIVT